MRKDEENSEQLALNNSVEVLAVEIPE